MPKVRRCAICYANNPHYVLVENQTSLRVALCAGCLRGTVQLLSHPQDLSRCLQAYAGAMLAAELVEVHPWV